MEWDEYLAYRKVENGSTFYYGWGDGEQGVMISASLPLLGVKVKKFLTLADYVSSKKQAAAIQAIRRRIEKWREGDPLTIIL